MRHTIRFLLIAAAVVLAQLAPVPMAWSAPLTRSAVVDDAADGTAEALDFPASHLAARWRGDHEAAVELRWRSEDGGWSAWAPVEHAPDMSTESVVYSGLVTTERAARVQARVVAGDVRDLEVVAIDTRYGPRRLVRPAPSAGSAAVASMADTRVPQPGVVTRAQWGADESLRSGTPSHAPIKRLVVHHTATSNGDPDPAATVRAIYAYHTQTRGWDDIGYNFLVDESGRIYEGRAARTYDAGEVPTGEDREGRGVIGAHVSGWNTGSVGVALLGSFGAQAPTNAAVEATRALLAWKADRHSIDVEASADGVPNLGGHRDVGSTSCPGDLLYERLPKLRRQVTDTVAAAHGRTKGYWVAANDGQVLPFGEAVGHGSMAGKRLNAPIIGMAAMPDGGGYWLLGSDGGIFTFGNARFHGSTGGMRLNKPVVGMAPTPKGDGYWLVASDGGIFSFGNAGFFGSTGGIRLNKPVVGMAPTPSGQGYWLVASDGGIFSFGDAAFRGSTGSLRLNSPIVAMDADKRGRGYWLVAADGGVFAFGVPFHGSIPGLKLPSYAGSVSLRATGSGRGYYILGGDGGVFTFGDAKFHGAKGVAPAQARDMALVEAAVP